MRGGILFLSIAFGLAAAVEPLTAQEVARQPGLVSTSDSMTVPSAEPTEPAPPGPAIISIGVGFSTPDTDLIAMRVSVQEAQGGIKGFFFGSRRRTSNTLMIGGVSLALIGVSVVKGHPGAIMGMAGLLSSIGGLYLAF